MPTETFELKATPAANPSLEETAAKMGIDVEGIDPTETSQTGEVVVEKPEGVPAKFWKNGAVDTEALLKSYTELEKSKSKPKDEAEADGEVKEEVKTEGEVVTEAEKAAKEAADKSGLNLDDLSKSFWENDGLTDDQYAALEKGGYKRELVDDFIEGQRALVATQKQQAYDAAGGSETSYKEMITWAGDNLDEEEIKAYDVAVASKNYKHALGAVKGLYARYTVANGQEPTLITGGAGRGDTDGYNSVQEMMADMADKRYNKDPAYTNKVTAKVGRSTAF